jgi:hypothetical protein
MGTGILGHLSCFDTFEDMDNQMIDKRFEGRRTMHVTMELTDAQWSAMESFFSVWNSLGSMGSSRWTAFFADGDGDFHPNVKVTQDWRSSFRKPTHTAILSEKLFWTKKSEEYRMDYDLIATWLHQEPVPPEHVCGLMGFLVGPNGQNDLCPACEVAAGRPPRWNRNDQA